MLVTVLEPKKVLYQGDAGEVIMPGDEGEFSVLDFHQPFLSRLKAGAVRVITRLRSRQAESGRVFPLSERRIEIKKGIAKMSGNELVVIAEI